MTMLNSSADRYRVARHKDPQKSAISNGSKLLPGIDQRSAWVRRCRDIIAEHLSDLGGHDNCSAAERSIVRRASVIEVELEMLEAKVRERRPSQRRRPRPVCARVWQSAPIAGSYWLAASCTRCDGRSCRAG